MERNIEELNRQYWAKRILSFYWIMILVSFSGSVIAFIVTLQYYPDETLDYVLRHMIFPTVLQIVALGISEYLVKVKKIYNPYLLLTIGTVIAFVVIIANTGLSGIPLIHLIPMAISLVFLNKKILTVSYIINVSSFIIVYFLSPTIRLTNPYEFSAYFLILTAGFIVYHAVLQRGLEVLGILKKTAEKEQALMIRTTIMEKLSKTDALTGLYNHKSFYGYFYELVKQSRQYQIPLQLAIIDIDNFKRINDFYGHHLGDIVIKTIADILTESVTTNDIVSRYGGEEFAIIFTEKTLEEAYQISENIRKAIMNVNHKEIEGQQVTVSIGLKQFDPSSSKTAFFQETDGLLYEAKLTGKNKVVIEKDSKALERKRGVLSDFVNTTR